MPHCNGGMGRLRWSVGRGGIICLEVVFFRTVGVGLGDALDRFGGFIRTWCERDGGSGRGGTWP